MACGDSFARVEVRWCECGILCGCAEGWLATGGAAVRLWFGTDVFEVGLCRESGPKDSCGVRR